MSPRGRCDIHDLALGPSGECILCRRSAAPPAQHEQPRREPPGFAMLMLPVGVLVVLLAGAGAIAVRFATWQPPPPPSVMPEASPAPVERPRLEPPPARRETSAERAARAARERRAREQGQPPPEARPDPLAATRPDRHQLAAARRRVSITMYGTSWCGYCTRARTWMRSEGISFVERDAEHDPRAQARLRQINPRGSVPTFEIDGEVIVGFSQGHLESTIDRAAQRHL